MDFNVNFFKLFSHTFRMVLNTLIGAFDDFLEKYLDRKNLVWSGSVRSPKFGSVRFGKKVFQIRFGSVRWKKTRFGRFLVKTNLTTPGQNFWQCSNGLASTFIGKKLITTV